MGKEAKLKAMSFVLVMDREIDPDRHYISPGEYELGGTQFDFMTSEGKIDETDRKKCRFDVYRPDTDSFDQAVTKNCLSGGFQEFFVYTGEAGEPEINPVAVENLVFYWDDGTETTADEKLLASAAAAVTNG